VRYTDRTASRTFGASKPEKGANLVTELRLELSDRPLNCPDFKTAFGGTTDMAEPAAGSSQS
jgi:hypothetical protein